MVPGTGPGRQRRYGVSCEPPRPQATLEDGLLDTVLAELLLGRDAPGAT